MKIRASLAIAFLFLFYTFSKAQSIRFENIGLKEGISQSTVLTIFQDSRGFMWFGTRDGLNRFDGYSIKVFKNIPEDKYSICHNYVTDIIEDSDGYIWVATLGGLNKFDPKTEKFYSFKHNDFLPQSLSNDLINSIVIDKKGNLWIGTSFGGLNLFDRKKNEFTAIQFPDTLSVDQKDIIKDIVVDKDDNLWIATHTAGLIQYNHEKKSFKRFLHSANKNSLSNNNVWALLQDNKENLWIATYGGGLNLLDKKTNSFKVYTHHPEDPASLCHDFTISLVEDNGLVYVGTENGGLSIFDPLKEKFSNYKNDGSDPTSLSSNTVNSLFRDIKGDIWIGTFNGGLSFYRKDANKFTHYKYNPLVNSLSNNKVLSIFEDSDENLWIGTDGGGLNLFDRKKGVFKHFKHDPLNKKSICGDNVLTIQEDSEKNLWIGTWGEGITIFNKEKNTFRHYKNNPDDTTSLSSNRIWTIYMDNDQDIWLGTFDGGFNLYDKKNDRFIRYKINPYDFINTFYHDSQGLLWIGTKGGGGLTVLNKKDQSTFQYRYDQTNKSIANDNINCIFEDKNNNLWLGTDAGLNYYERDKKEFSNYRVKDGLPNDIINGILNDKNGHLWLSTNKGLSRFTPATKAFKNYSVADGLQSDEFRQAYCKSRNGKFYFGGINGFNEFYPDSIKDQEFDPPIVLTDFQIFNNRVPIRDSIHSDSPLETHISLTKQITISYQQSVFSIEFASLNYTVPEKKQYQYILEGFDKNWNNIGTKRFATYTNLDPGKYIFKVKGLDNTGNFSTKTTELVIVITPPYWKTWWFRTLIVLLSISLSFLFFKWRVRNIEKQKNMLEEQVQVRTSELQNANHELFKQKEEILNQKEEIESQKDQIQKLYIEVRSSIRAAQDIQNSIIPSEENIKKYLPESFIFNKPKDVVSGDFYWFDVIEDKIILAAVDCTGHGVSGAFMSINGHHLLNQAIYPYQNLIASEILDRLNVGVIKEFNNKGNKTIINDGMDIALCIIEKEKKVLQYAGANNPLYIIRNKEIIQIMPDRFTIGGYRLDGKTRNFTNHTVDLKPGDVLFIFSDGYADQMGGENGDEKFMYPRFRELLLKIHHLKMEEQLEVLRHSFEEWRTNQVEQLDDILVIGFKV